MEPVIYETTCFEVWTDMGTEYVPLHYISDNTGLKHTELGIMHREGKLRRSDTSKTHTQRTKT